MYTFVWLSQCSCESDTWSSRTMLLVIITHESNRNTWYILISIMLILKDIAGYYDKSMVYLSSLSIINMDHYCEAILATLITDAWIDQPIDSSQGELYGLRTTFGGAEGGAWAPGSEWQPAMVQLHPLIYWNWEPTMRILWHMAMIGHESFIFLV